MIVDVAAPGLDYEASLNGCTAGLRADRRFLRVTGKAPGEMLNGLLTNRIPDRVIQSGEGVGRASVVYSALLTAKGKMITDLRVFRGLEDGLVLEVPAEGIEGARSHFKRFLPPRLATVEDASEDSGVVTVLGPNAPALLTTVVRGMRLMEEGGCQALSAAMAEVQGLQEGEEILLPQGIGEVFRLTRNGETRGLGWDLLLPRHEAEELVNRLQAEGGLPLTEASLKVLRLEKGRPAFGQDMDENTIPVEAGIQHRAIDYGKGCYTGQEVIVRIRDRGQVNKNLRGLLLGEAPAPAPGVELYQHGHEKSVGWITSAVASPAFAQTIALGYLRRGVGVGAVVRLGGQDGPEGQVRELDDKGWVMAEMARTI